MNEEICRARPVADITIPRKKTAEAIQRRRFAREVSQLLGVIMWFKAYPCRE